MRKPWKFIKMQTNESITILSAFDFLRSLSARLTGDLKSTGGVRGLLSAALELAETNHELWREEDLARRLNVEPIEIVANKRMIDKLNQSRNNQIELIDIALYEQFFGATSVPRGRLNSESPGSMLDRMSIMSLKTFYYSKKLRENLSDEFRTEITTRISNLESQRLDLASCFDQLISECVGGVGYFRVYQQYKMYNDERLRTVS